MKKIGKVIIGIIVFLFCVCLLDYIGSFKNTHAYDVEVIDNQIYLTASSIGGYITDTKLIEIEEGVYKIENKGSIFYGERERRASFDNSDGHIKEIRSYRSDYPNGYWVVYPIQEHQPFELESVSLMIIEDDERTHYELKETIDKDKFFEQTQNYASTEKFLENTYLDIVVDKSYAISFKFFSGKIERYRFFNGYLLYENMNYLYQVDHYDQVIDSMLNNFI